MFQSSAGFDPGRYVSDALVGDKNKILFQSSAGFDPGRYTFPVGDQIQASVFQSSAGFDPGRYAR